MLLLGVTAMSLLTTPMVIMLSNSLLAKERGSSWKAYHAAPGVGGGRSAGVALAADLGEPGLLVDVGAGEGVPLRVGIRSDSSESDAGHER